MNVNITYRRTSRLSMRISKSGDVNVSAPIGYPKREIIKFIESHREWIADAVKNTLQKQTARQNFFSRLPLETKVQCAEATNRMNALIKPLVYKYSNLMNVSPSSIYYRATVSKWGCCNVKTRRIMFSTYLLLLPEWCAEHIVVHELAHLLVPNHSSDFYAVMNKYFPRWKEARKETRRVSRGG